jgi:flagellar basal body-associated protein FliL
MKKVLLTLLAVIVIVGALAGAGYAGYRVGINQGATSSGNLPFFGRSERMNPGFMHNFDRDFGPGFNSYHSPMMGRGDFGFSIFSPLRMLWNIAVLALVIWFLYWLFTKSGWQITRQTGKEQETSPAKTEG